MTIDIDYLFVGEAEYKKKSGYGPTYMKDGEYPFNVAAFIPTRLKLKKKKSHKNLSKVKSYIRIINMLVSDPLCAKCFDKNELFREGGKTVVNHFKKKGVYFCNKDELKKELFENNLIKNKWQITSKTKIYLIGSKAILKIGTWESKGQILYLPHPARHSPFWKNYDLDTRFTPHSPIQEVEKSLRMLKS